MEIFLQNFWIFPLQFQARGAIVQKSEANGGYRIAHSLKNNKDKGIVMKAICPNNPEHKEFITSAHEVHDWVVNQNGEFIKDLCCTQTSAGPNIDNIWTCISCRAIAVVK